MPRTGEQAQGLKTTSSHPHAACGGGKSTGDRARVTTHSAWKTRQSSEATASNHVQRLENKRQEEHTQPQIGRRCSFQPNADDKRSGTSGLPRAETENAPVEMSRDECLHGRRQLWAGASATRELMPQEDITQITPSMVTPVKDSSRRSSRCRRDEPCSPPGPRPKVGWPTEAEVRWIIKREDDPEEESRSPTMRPRKRAAV